MGLDILVLVVLSVIISFIYYSYIQLNNANIKVIDFVKFVYSSEKMSELYIKARYYEILNKKDQARFLKDSKELFENFDKVPKNIWSDEYAKYEFIQKKYNNIRLNKWKNNA